MEKEPTGKTAKAVEVVVGELGTLLKQGVNERPERAEGWDSIQARRILIRPHNGVLMIS